MTLGKTKVLVVDDEENVVESIKRTLRHEDYEVICLTSPVEALQRLEEGDIDVLLSDIDMPEMTGLELIAIARAKYPQVARLLLTGDSSMQSALTAINDGAVHKYLTKPWSSKELRENLRGIVSSLKALQREGLSSQSAIRAEEKKAALEEQHPGFCAIRRAEGAYLLNDMHVVESLDVLGEVKSLFEASRWLPGDSEQTENLRGR